MEVKNTSSFSFLVLVYNQESYVIDHLESIKYLVLRYAKNIDVDILINDDCSIDNSVLLINNWLKLNKSLFRNIKTLYNSKNIGTSQSVINLLKFNVSDKCKITAADDIYSHENIFISESFSKSISIQSGYPIMLENYLLKESKFSNFLLIASQEIYKKNKLLHRFKHFSLNNAPNMFYEVKCLQNVNVMNFLNKFDVIEDWPIQIQIAREFPDFKFELIDKVFVYYRRTPGSTYIVANKRFILDKVAIYNDLIKSEINLFEKFRLINRKVCFVMNNRYFNIIFNIDFYLFLFATIFNLRSIIKKMHNLNLNLDSHIEHYNYIKQLSNSTNFEIMK